LPGASKGARGDNKEVVLMDDRPRRSDRGFSDRPREMHTVKCSDCGAEAQVPFKPTEGRPVYCKDCYQKHRPPRRF
jgi:CxxC-x17-CxxC domain-containing protein